MNNSGKFLVSALLVHAARLKKLGDSARATPVPQNVIPGSPVTPASNITNK